jgi:hypothetical protein
MIRYFYSSKTYNYFLFLTLGGSIGKFLLAVLDGNRAVIAQTVERIHGKDEVPSSILGNGSIQKFAFQISDSCLPAGRSHSLDTSH